MNRPQRKNSSIKSFFRGISGPPTLLESQKAELGDDLRWNGFTCRACEVKLTTEEVGYLDAPLASAGLCNRCEKSLWGMF
jgi:hypothetical protein